jgi:hypothetical protein
MYYFIVNFIKSGCAGVSYTRLAQNLQLKEQPICEETQAVFLSSAGIKNTFYQVPVNGLETLLTVPSSEYWVGLYVMRQTKMLI